MNRPEARLRGRLNFSYLKNGHLGASRSVADAPEMKKGPCGPFFNSTAISTHAVTGQASRREHRLTAAVMQHVVLGLAVMQLRHEASAGQQVVIAKGCYRGARQLRHDHGDRP